MYATRGTGESWSWNFEISASTDHQFLFLTAPAVSVAASDPAGPVFDCVWQRLFLARVRPPSDVRSSDDAGLDRDRPLDLVDAGRWLCGASQSAWDDRHADAIVPAGPVGDGSGRTAIRSFPRCDVGRLCARCQR